MPGLRVERNGHDAGQRDVERRRKPPPERTERLHEHRGDEDGLTVQVDDGRLDEHRVVARRIEERSDLVQEAAGKRRDIERPNDVPRAVVDDVELVRALRPVSFDPSSTTTA